MTDCEIGTVQFEMGALYNWKWEISVTGSMHDQQLLGLSD